MIQRQHNTAKVAIVSSDHFLLRPLLAQSRVFSSLCALLVSSPLGSLLVGTALFLGCSAPQGGSHLGWASLISTSLWVILQVNVVPRASHMLGPCS